MGWATFTKSATTGTIPEVDDANIMVVQETGSNFLTLPYDIVLQDIVLTAATSGNHQFSIWVNGKKQSANLFSAQINPASQTRFNIAAQRVRIPKGSQIQIKSSQKSGTAEAASLTLVWSP